MKEVTYEYDCRRLFIVHELVDFPGQHRHAMPAPAGTVQRARHYHRSSVSTSVTTVSISYRAKQLLARASAERSVVDRLQALVDAFHTDRSLTLRGRNAGAEPADGMDFFKIVGGSGNDVIRAYARPPRSMPAPATI